MTSPPIDEEEKTPVETKSHVRFELAPSTMAIMIGIIAAVCSFPRKQVASSEPGQTQ